MRDPVDVAIVGAGAAGLMAAIWAARTAPGARVVALDGAPRIGAKILISGGGRCNVTHDVADEGAFAGASPNAVRKVLRRFDVGRTVAFFREIGVELKREETGKLFPVTDRARTVLDALLRAASEARAEIRFPRRVETIRREEDAFAIAGAAAGAGAWGSLRARRVVLATGGMSVPKTGSDGGGYALARSLGHTITPRVFPALVPLVLEEGHFLRGLAGLSAEATLEVRSAGGKRIAAATGSLLATHFGVSGPAVLDISRHYLDAAAGDPGARLVASWLPGASIASVDAMLRGLGPTTVLGALRSSLPERLARAVATGAGVDPATPGHRLTREGRRALARALVESPLPVTGDRGFAVAEVTAGGVPLQEIRLETMASRACPGLHLCGEILAVDGRIGGYNFQWAWTTGYLAGVAASR